MENWQLALTLLVAVLVGSLIPVMVQLWSTLRGFNDLVRHTDEMVLATRPGLERAVTEIGTTAAHLNRVGSVLEQGDVKMREAMNALDGLREWLVRFKQGTTILTMIGTTVVPLVLDVMRRAKENAEQKAAEAVAHEHDLEKHNHAEKEMES